MLVNEARVLEADVEAKNGRLYSVDGVLIPPSVEPLLPHRCDVTSWKIVEVSMRSDGLCYFSPNLNHSPNLSLSLFCLLSANHTSRVDVFPVKEIICLSVTQVSVW